MALRDRLTYANVMSTIAVFAVLAGGGAYAASKIGAKDIKTGAVRSRQVKDESLLAKDFQPGQLPSGAAGATGPAGSTGAAGSSGTTPPPQAPILVTDFVGGWSAYDAGTGDPNDDTPVSYWKDSSGVVHLEGGVTFGTASQAPDNALIFTLPPGYRPAVPYANFPVLTTGFFDFDQALGFIQITGEKCCPTTPGQVIWDGDNGGNSEFVSLDGITFRAE
jgi:hypothetical protein